MPSAGPIQDTPKLDIVTNQYLIETHEQGHILSGQFFQDGSRDGSNQFIFSIPPAGHTVMISHSLKTSFGAGDSGHEPVHYFSRGEIQGDIEMVANEKAALTSNYRLLRIMPILTIVQDGKELMHLTLRGLGGSDAGKWSCASSLAASKVDTATIFATLNRETGLLVDGQVAVFAPTLSEGTDAVKIASQGQELKKCLSKKSPELGVAFDKNASVLVIDTKMNLPTNADTVTFYQAVTDEVKCIVSDNPEQRTLTLMFPLRAELPKGSVLTAFNGQGYDGPAALVDPKYLQKQPGIDLIPGLREFVCGGK